MELDLEQLGLEQDAADAGDKPEGDGKPADGKPNNNADDMAALRAQMRKLERELEREKAEKAQLRESEKTWAKLVEEATRTKSTPAPKVEEELDLTGDQILDLLATKGTRGLKELGITTERQVRELVKRTMAEELGQVEEKIDAKLQQKLDHLGRQASVLRDYPELNDPESEFTVSVVQEYEAMVKDDPDLKDKRGTWRKAAEVVDLRRKIEELKSGRKPDSERIDRIRRQSSDGIGRGTGDERPRISRDAIVFAEQLGVGERLRKKLGGGR